MSMDQLNCYESHLRISIIQPHRNACRRIVLFTGLFFTPKGQLRLSLGGRELVTTVNLEASYTCMRSNVGLKE
ncbi:hypothetical protein KC19_9G135000 [Ceratodon purpureus]|uniref:Uncharacterized protein n=1 Tax=Ceratodon purpureus TaxID=3225 RepID=A0A8T0GUR1_CERPU|nr:hypothetical protein KC19_9G135000 [Ceratodon purpureus]